MAKAAVVKLQESMQVALGREAYRPRKKPANPFEPVKLIATPRPKTLSLEARMKDPIFQVDVQTGEVLVDRIREYWAREE